MAHAAVDALGHEAVPLADLERDRPVRPEVRVRPVEEPEPERHARVAGDEGDRTKGVVRELEPRSRDPGEREEEAHPGERQEDRLPRAL